jgi:hypothetical protein
LSRPDRNVRLLGIATETIARRSPGILRRWLRFSLGSVFVLITLICLVLGLWIVPAQRLDKAVAELRKSGGFVQKIGCMPNQLR